MYILMISRGFPSKRYPQFGCFEKDQAEALAKVGHKVVALSVDARFSFHRNKLGLNHFMEKGVEYYNYTVFPAKFTMKTFGEEFFWKRIYSRAIEKGFVRIVREHGLPDLIYSQFFHNTAAAVGIRNKYGVPVVGIEHLGRFNESELAPIDERWARIAFSGADRMISVAGTLAGNIRKRFGVESDVVHNMYGSEFGRSAEELSSIDKVTKRPFVFVSTATLVYLKGFDMLIGAFVKTRMPADSWKLNIIGDGPERENLQKQIERAGLTDNVKLLGRKVKKEIVEELRKSNVFVLPSRTENFSVAILEALSMGLPVISTDVGGIRECLTPDNGMIVPPDDPEAMADALRDMVENYDRYDRKAIAEDCERRFSPEAIAGKLTDVFEETLKSRKK